MSKLVEKESISKGKSVKDTDGMIGIGIAGCGSVAEVHAEALQQVDGARLVTAFSRTLENARVFGDEYDVDSTDEWEEFIGHSGLDLVIICTPSGTHLDYGRMAAHAGKHVVVEKPIEITLGRAKSLISICEERGVELAVIYQNRFLSAVQKMKKTIDEGKIGKIHLADAYVKWYRSPDYYQGSWHGTLRYDGGGALINQSIHTIDLLQWFMGDVDRIYGRIGSFVHPNIEGEDTAVATLDFRSGAIGILEGATSIIPAQDRRIELHGNQGSAYLRGEEFALIRSPEDEESSVGEGGSSGAESPYSGFSSEPHQHQLGAIVQALREGSPPPVSGEESLKSLAIVRAIYLSAREGKPVTEIYDEAKPGGTK